MRLKLIAGAVLVAALHWGAGDAAARSCYNDVPSPCKAYDQAYAVFVGRVIGSHDVAPERKDGTRRLYTFAVREQFKGPDAAVLEVGGGVVGASFLTDFTTGVEYLVYAHGDSLETLGAGTCTRNRLAAAAENDLHFLRAHLAGAREPRVYGTVTLFDNDPRKPDDDPRVALAGIKVEVAGAERTYEATTDDAGRFALDDLPEGDYTIRPVLPSRYMAYFSGEQNVTIGDDAYGDYHEFLIGWNTKLEGRVLDGDGRAVKQATVRLVPADGQPPLPGILWVTGYYDEGGRYEVVGYAPGRYFVSVDSSDAPAEEVVLAIGEKVTLDLQLGPEEKN